MNINQLEDKNLRTMKWQSFTNDLKNKYYIGYFLNGFLIIAVIVLLISPSAKALLLRGMMKMGLYQPNITAAGIAKTAAEFSLEDDKGNILTLSSLRGKVVFLNFWATWCPPCIAEMPDINSLSEKLKDNKNVQFIMVDVDHNLKRSRSFMLKHKLSLPLYQAKDGIPTELLDQAIPTTIILDKNGRILFRHEGGADYGNPKVLDYLNKISK